MASICCSRPDIVPAIWRRRSASRGNSSNTSCMDCFALRARARQQRAHLEVLLDGQAGEDLAPFRHLADAEVAR